MSRTLVLCLLLLGILPPGRSCAEAPSRGAVRNGSTNPAELLSADEREETWAESIPGGPAVSPPIPTPEPWTVFRPAIVDVSGCFAGWVQFVHAGADHRVIEWQTVIAFEVFRSDELHLEVHPAFAAIELVPCGLVATVSALFGDDRRLEIRRERMHPNHDLAIVSLDQLERNSRRFEAKLSHAHDVCADCERLEEKAAVRARESRRVPADELHLQMLIGLLFNRIHAGLGSTADEGWGGLRKSHLRVLQGVPGEGTSVTELAERVGLTKQGCGQLVTQLVDLGQLTEEDHPSDGRVRLVRRSPAGERTLRDFREAIDTLEGELARTVGVRRYREFRAVLEELALQ